MQSNFMKKKKIGYYVVNIAFTFLSHFSFKGTVYLLSWLHRVEKGECWKELLLNLKTDALTSYESFNRFQEDHDIHNKCLSCGPPNLNRSLRFPIVRIVINASKVTSPSMLFFVSHVSLGALKCWEKLRNFRKSRGKLAKG